MQALDNEFFEAYKRLDSLCSDIYGCRNGVSQYIEDMEHSSHQGQLAVPMWDQSYKTLKHLRWVRNQIAHDSGQLQFCEEYDLQNITNFYDSIISGQDPLTLLRKYRETNPDKKVMHCTEFSAFPFLSSHFDAVRPTRRRIGCFAAVILLLAGASAILGCLLTFLL